MHRVLNSRINNDQTLRTVYNSYTYTLFASVNMSKYFRTLVSGDDKLFHQLQHINAVVTRLSCKVNFSRATSHLKLLLTEIRSSLIIWYLGLGYQAKL